MSFRSSWHRLRGYLSGLLTNEFLWGGLVALVLLVFGTYLLFDEVIMPSYTRHEASVTVPDVTNKPFSEAAQVLRNQNLTVKREVQRFNPDAPRDVVLDQMPPASSTVKPGRRVYLTVNAGETPMVQVPPVENMSLREAQNRIMSVGLTVDETLPDSVPAPYPNTVTRQQPAAGDSLKKGGNVTLWYSTGLGEEYAEIPDVTDTTVAAAREALLKRKIRSVIVNRPEDATDEEVAEMTVNRQSREPGTRVRQGFEVRLFLEEEKEEEESE